MDLIARLRTERQELVSRLEEIDKILSQMSELEDAARKLLGDESVSSGVIDNAHVDVSHANGDATDSAATTRKKTPTDEFEAAVVEILRNAGRPMERVELYDELLDRGIVIGGSDRDKELNILSARTYRMTQNGGPLTSKRGQGYSLKPVLSVDEPPHSDDFEDVLGGDEPRKSDTESRDTREIGDELDEL